MILSPGEQAAAKRRQADRTGDRVMFRTVGEEGSELAGLACSVGLAEERSGPASQLPLTESPGDRRGVIATVNCVRGGLPPRVLRRVCDHIDTHIEKRISVQDLAAMSPRDYRWSIP
jgi:hypothetical protein